MAGDPSCFTERLLKMELRQPPSKDGPEAEAEIVAAEVAEAAGATAEAMVRAGTEAATGIVVEADAIAVAVESNAHICEHSEEEDEEDEDGDDVDEEEEDEEYTEPDDLEELIELVTSESRRNRFLGAMSIRRRVSDRYEAPAYSRLLTSPALAALLANLDRDSDQELQFESLWALTNLLAGSGARPSDLVSASGLARPLIQLLESAPTDRMREQACWALANVAGESPAWRDQLLTGGDLLGALTALWESDPNNGLLDASSLLLINLFRDREPRIRFELAQFLLPQAVRLLRHPYESVVPHLVWALSYAVEDCEPRARLLLQLPDALACLAEFLDSQDNTLLVPTLRLFCSLSACLEPLPACLIAPDSGVFRSVRRLLNHLDGKIRRQALLFFGNVSGGPDAQLEAAAQAGCLTGIGQILSGSGCRSGSSDGGGCSGEVGCSGGGGETGSVGATANSELERREAFWIVPNFMFSRGHRFSRRIIDECLEGLLESLCLQEVEVSRCGLLCVRHLLFAARYRNRDDMDFEALKRKIEAKGGLKKIELAQKTDDKELVKLSYQIIDQFFLGNEKKYLEEGPSKETNPSPADSEIGDEQLDAGGLSELRLDKDALSSLIGGLQARD